MWVFPGRPDQVREARHVMARWLDANGCTRIDDCLVVLSEFAANAVVHSASRDQFFTVRAGVHAGYCWCECEDAGGAGLLSLPTKTAPTGFRSWQRSPAPGTGVLTETQAGAWRGPGW